MNLAFILAINQKSLAYDINQGPNVGKGYFSSQKPGLNALVAVLNASADITLTVQVLTYNGENVSFDVLPGSTYFFGINNIQLIGILSSAGTGTATGVLVLFPSFEAPEVVPSFITYDFSQGPSVGKGYLSSQIPGLNALVRVENTSTDITLTVQIPTYSGDVVSFVLVPGSTYSVNINNIQLIGILSSTGSGSATGLITLFPV